MFIAARFGSATAAAARARAESRDGVVRVYGRVARRLRRLRRHVAEDALPLACGGQPDRLGPQARRLVAVGPVEDRRRLYGQRRVRRRGDAVDVGVGACPDRRVAGRRHARKRRTHGLGTYAATEHSPHVRRGGRVAVFAEALLAESVEADEDRTVRRGLRHARRSPDEKGRYAPFDHAEESRCRLHDSRSMMASGPFWRNACQHGLSHRGGIPWV